MPFADEATMVRRADRVDARVGLDPSSASARLKVDADDPAAVATTLTQLAASNFAVAITALQQGIGEIGQLHARCAQLRAELSDAEDRQKARLLTLQDEILHWQDMVCDLADRYQDNQAQLQGLLVQHGLTQKTAARDQKRAETAERRSSSFERLVLGLHDQILSAIVKDRCDTAELGATTGSSLPST